MFTDGSSPFKKFLQDAVKNVGESFDNTIRKVQQANASSSTLSTSTPTQAAAAPSQRASSLAQPNAVQSTPPPTSSSSSFTNHHQHLAVDQPLEQNSEGLTFAKTSKLFSEFFEKNLVPKGVFDGSSPLFSATSTPTQNQNQNQNSTGPAGGETPVRKVRTTNRIQVKLMAAEDGEIIRIRIRERIPVSKSGTLISPTASSNRSSADDLSVGMSPTSPSAPAIGPSPIPNVSSATDSPSATPDYIHTDNLGRAESAPPLPLPLAPSAERPSGVLEQSQTQQMIVDHAIPKADGTEEIHVLRSQFAAVQNRLAQSEKQCKDIRELLSVKERQVEQSQVIITNLQREVQDVTCKLAKTAGAMEANQQLSSEGDQLAQKVSLLESRVKQLRAEKRDADVRLVRLNELEGMHKEVSENYNKLREWSSAAGRDLEEKTKLLDAVEKRCNLAEAENVDLKNRIKRAATDTQSRIDALRVKLTSDLEAQQQLNARTKDEYENTISMLMEQMKCLQVRLRDTATAPREVVDPNSDLLKQIESLERSMSSQKVEFYSVRQMLQERLAGFESREADMLLKYEEKESKERALLEKIRSLERQHSSMQLLVLDAEKQCESAKSEASRIRAESDSLQSLFALEKTQLLEKVESLRIEVQNLQKQLMSQHLSFQTRLEQHQSQVTPSSVPDSSGQRPPFRYSLSGSELDAGADGPHTRSSGHEQSSPVAVDEDDLDSASVLEPFSRPNGSDLVHELRLKIDKLSLALARERRVSSKMRKLEIRYEMALQLIGEKEERVLELEADLAHVKEMFREQVATFMPTSSS
eukprot:ANDGO_04854.mRNA.1 hypothetical protein